MWKEFPQDLRLPYAEFISFMSTVHLAFPKNNFIYYQFPPPQLESFFHQGLIMSMTENWTDKENKNLKSSQFIKAAYNSFFKTGFKVDNRISNKINPAYDFKKRRVMIPFSFGKDSLLTYAICRELNLDVIPIFIIEPRNVYENKFKLKMIRDFEKEFHQPIEIYQVPLTDLKHWDAYSWGWDLLLTQYMMYLIPFQHYYKPEYFFWSNELNCSQTIVDPEGFFVDRTFDQHWRWLQTMNTAIGLFGCNTQVGSLVEVISEYADNIILHSRYPQIAKYQLTCQAENSRKRWCGDCYDCANTYMYLVSVGMDPKNIWLMDNMFSKQKYHKLKLFDSPKTKNYFWRDHFPFLRDEKLLALYFASKRGIKDHAVRLFDQEYLSETKKKLVKLKQMYLTVHEFHTVPDDLIKTVSRIFNEELRNVFHKLN